MTSSVQTSTRNTGLDLLRVIAIYMVIQIHTGEFYYIGPHGVINDDGSFAVGLLNSLLRCAVPLFLMISGFFLLPVKDKMSVFFKKRFTRILIPFVIWCIIYSFYQFFMGQVDIQKALINICMIPVNFGTQVGHLWYIYMLMGIYLIAPVISPWLKEAPKSNIQFFLGIWAFSGLVPYIHLVFPEILGECFWNSTPMLYYFSGYLGYAVLGAYIRRFCSQRGKWDIALGLELLAAGYAITAFGFITRLNTASSIPELELTWSYNTLNIAMMALGFFLLVKNVSFSNRNTWYSKLIEDISIKSFGMYFLHIIILNAVYSVLNVYITNYFIKIPAIAFITFISSYIIIKLMSYLPKSKYIIG